MKPIWTAQALHQRSHDRRDAGSGHRVRDDVRVSDDASRPDPVPETQAGRSKLPYLLLLASGIYIADLVTKILAVEFIDPSDPISIIGDTVTLTLVRNPGAAFSMATGMTWLLSLVAIAVVIGVIRIGRTLRSPWWVVGLGLVLGGAVGNLTDRLFRSPGPLQGHVVDFVSVGWWPVFNVADSAVVCGAILLVALTLFGFEPDGTRAGRTTKSDTEQDGQESDGRKETQQ
ncbi:MAG: signal peptidase II [Rhodococcus sp.]|nr:signal peptidase II [Rhodococcus sp. (in: high G+C Gram-positive bacteria)]